MSGSTYPLKGIKVVEFSHMVLGPSCGLILADLGADVVKIERPDDGYGMRQWPPLTGETEHTSGFSENFASVNRNERSVTRDLKHADDLAQLKQLVAVADIVIENY